MTRLYFILLSSLLLGQSCDNDKQAGATTTNVTVTPTVQSKSSDTTATVTVDPRDTIIINEGHFLKLSARSRDVLLYDSFPKITDSDHSCIIRCINTISYYKYKGFIYDTLIKVVADKKYLTRLQSKYKDWTATKDSGYYFQKLNLQLYGAFDYYSKYRIGTNTTLWPHGK
jgi:hypothetical protein